MFRRFALGLLVPLISSAANTSAPAVTGIVNSASNRAPGLSASGIAQGSIFSVYGSNLGPASCNAVLAFPLPTSMCGVSLTVTVNGTSTAPIPLFVYATQINAILPSLTPTGSGTITVTYNNQTSATSSIQVVNAAFGTFTPDSTGSGQASVTDVNNKLNTIINTLHPGDIGILWGTGLGPIAGSDANPPPVGNLPEAPTVYVGNTAVTPSYAGRSGCCSGLDQIVFTVPQGVLGCYVPIAVQAGGAVGNIGTIAVSAAGQSTCSDSVMGQDLVNKLASGGNVNFGYIRLESTIATVAGVATSGTGALGDYAYATFTAFTPQTAYYAEYGVSAGYCVSTEYSYAPSGSISYNFISDLSVFDFSALLDAGSALSIQGPLDAPGPFSQLYPGYGYYALYLTPNVTHYVLSDENYTVAGTGGANVGAFAVTDTTSISSATLTGIATNQSIPRSSDLTVQWTGGNPALQNGLVTIGGFSASSDFSLYTSFQCTAPAAAQKFAIPSWVLSTLPPSGTQQSGSLTVQLGFIWIGQYNTPTAFTAPGLDRGIITDVFFRGQDVSYQ